MTMNLEMRLTNVEEGRGDYPGFWDLTVPTEATLRNAELSL